MKKLYSKQLEITPGKLVRVDVEEGEGLTIIGATRLGYLDLICLIQVLKGGAELLRTDSELEPWD